MKHPLTSKERRGLVAIAAAALLCIGSGFAFRSCRSYGHAPGGTVVVVDDSDSAACAADSISEEMAGRGGSYKSDKSDKYDKSDKSDKSVRSKKAGKTKKIKTEKTFPTRSPLDEPCDTQNR